MNPLSIPMRRTNSLGRVVLVRFDGSTQNAIETDPNEDVSTWTIQAQPLQAMQQGTNLLVTYWVGDASFTLPLLSLNPTAATPTVGPMVRTVVDATKVRLDIVTPPAGGGGQGSVSVGVVKGGGLRGPERSGGKWIQTPAAAGVLADNYLVQQGPGSLYAATVNVVTFAAGVNVLYALLFDQGAAGHPVANAVPIPGGRSTQLAPGNPSAQFDGSFMPVQWMSGLVPVLSTTADVYTAPAAGQQFTFDGFVGQ